MSATPQFPDAGGPKHESLLVILDALFQIIHLSQLLKLSANGDGEVTEK